MAVTSSFRQVHAAMNSMGTGDSNPWGKATGRRSCRSTRHLVQWVEIHVRILGGLGKTRYGLDGPGIESWWEAIFSAPIQTGLGVHPSSCTVGKAAWARCSPSTPT